MSNSEKSQPFSIIEKVPFVHLGLGKVTEVYLVFFAVAKPSVCLMTPGVPYTSFEAYASLIQPKPSSSSLLFRAEVIQ